MENNSDPDRGYTPLPSIWEGGDEDLLERMLEFYPNRHPELILDATVNSRRFWRNSTRPVVGLDINSHYRPDVLASSVSLPFSESAFDVVVYDPPHIPNQGRDRQKDFNLRFGLGVKSSAETKYNFSHTYPPFMAEAYRVLRPEGVLFCKITDYVHNHRFQWAHVDMLKAGSDAGFCPCDSIVKIRKGPIVDPRWKIAHHSRRRHTYWLIFRRSSKCE